MLNPMLWQMLYSASLETLYMVGVSVLLAGAVGGPLGVISVVTAPGQILASPVVSRVLSVIINIGRSVPFIILMVAIIPFTRLITGTSIGTSAAIVPLTVAAIPFVARLVETALLEVDRGVIEAATAMGATPWQIIRKVLIPEALPALVLSLTVTTINLISYSAMAGAIGGGGLGDLAIRYGYQRFQVDVMIATVVFLVILVQLIQSLGESVAKGLRHR
jgi:D-methionine transport system permease protein